jgi:hypothetical protein
MEDMRGEKIRLGKERSGGEDRSGGEERSGEQGRSDVGIGPYGGREHEIGERWRGRYGM